MSIDCMNRVWKQSAHKGTQLLAMLALADRANEHGVCWPGVADIATRARTEKRHAKRVIKSLYESGELFFEEGGGRHHTNLYLVCVGMNDTQILDALTNRQWFQLSPLEARVVVSQLRERQAAFAAQNSDPQDTLSDEIAEHSDEPATKGDVQDTLSPKGGADARKGVLDARKGVLDARKGVLDARKGDIAVSPESSITINESTFNLYESDERAAFWKLLQDELKLMQPRATYITHFQRLKPVRYENGGSPPRLVLATANAQSFAWLNARYRQTVETLIERLTTIPILIEFELIAGNIPDGISNE